MLGAIAGDVIGSPYEFGQGDKTTDFPLFSPASAFTDDTVMTVAVADALLTHPTTEGAAELALIESMRRWGALFPHPGGGYGARFEAWLTTPDPQPYGSFGNGSAMRVSPVIWLFDTLDEVERWADVTARVTHNHPEGVKGAQATAAAGFLARKGTARTVIRRYVEDHFGYDLSRSVAEIRPGYHHVESCQETVPEAITCFLEAEDYEGAVRGAVSLGGDADTLGAITGAVAQSAFGVPGPIREATIARLDARVVEVLTRFEDEVGLTPA